MEQPQASLATEESHRLVPRLPVIALTHLQLDPGASKDIRELDWPGVTRPEAQVNADQLTDDLAKARADSDRFWLVGLTGQPHVALEPVEGGKDGGGSRGSARGCDCRDTKTGDVESGRTNRIALWMAEPDSDACSLIQRQAFSPMAGARQGRAKLAWCRKAEIDAA